MVSINLDYKGVRVSLSRAYVETAGMSSDKFAETWIKYHPGLVKNVDKNGLKAAIAQAVKPFCKATGETLIPETE